jgi:hypothetical protein
VYVLAEASSIEALETNDYDWGGQQECNLRFWKEYDKRIKELKELEVK